MSEDVERVAIMSIDGGIPLEWAQRLAALCAAPMPSAYLPERWAVIVEDACRLIGNWSAAIVQQGWTAAEVKGLLPFIQSREIIAIGIGDVSVVHRGERAKIYRRPRGDGTFYWSDGRAA